MLQDLKRERERERESKKLLPALVLVANGIVANNPAVYTERTQLHQCTYYIYIYECKFGRHYFWLASNMFEYWMTSCLSLNFSFFVRYDFRLCTYSRTYSQS